MEARRDPWISYAWWAYVVPLMASLRRRIADGRLLLLNASSIVSTTLVTSGLGFVYWWAAARLLPPEAVGFAAACVSAMALLGRFGMGGMGTLLVGELPRRKDNVWPLITTAMIPAFIFGGVLGIIVALAASHLSAGLAPLAQSFGAILLFTVGAGLTAAALVLDDAFLGLLRGQLQLQRNVALAGVKLVVLVLVGLWLRSSGGLGIFFSWVLGIFVSMVIVAVIQGLRSGHIPAWRPDFRLLQGLWLKSISHQFLNLAQSISGLGLPVLVTSILPLSYSAYFYTAWMIANLTFTAPSALTYTLYALGSAQPQELARKTRMTLVLSTLFGILASGFVLLFGARLLALFGPAYALHASAPLAMLVLAIFPVIVRHHYVAIQRVRGQIMLTALVGAIAGVPELGFAALGASLGGLTGMSLGWIIALYLESIPMSIVVWRVVRSRGALAVPITDGHLVVNAK